MVVQVPQFPDPLTPTFLMGAMDFQFLYFSFEVLVIIQSKRFVHTQWARFPLFKDPVDYS